MEIISCRSVVVVGVVVGGGFSTEQLQEVSKCVASILLNISQLRCRDITVIKMSF